VHIGCCGGGGIQCVRVCCGRVAGEEEEEEEEEDF